MLAGQLIAGASVSLIVTLKVQVPVSVAASVAVQVTVVVPLAKVLPDAGTQATVAPGQLSTAVGVVYVTTAVQTPVPVLWITFAGQVTVGPCVSLTVTVKVQVAVLAAASVAVQVTVVVPFAKTVAEAGLQATVEPGQLSAAVGVV